MKQTSELYRGVFQTRNRWTLLVDGTARAAIEAALVSLIEPGDRVLVPVFGRFGHLKVEIAKRCGAEVRARGNRMGHACSPRKRSKSEISEFKPKLVAVSHGDTSTTMAQPLADLGKLCREHDAMLYVDATATLGGMDLPADAWQLDVVSAGLQKCLGGPPGSAPLTLNERAEKRIVRRRHTEAGPPASRRRARRRPGHPLELLRPRDDHGLLVGQGAQPPHRGHHHALRRARVRAHPARGRPAEVLRAPRARLAGAWRPDCRRWGSSCYGDQAHKMPNVTGVHIPQGVDGEAVRRALLEQHNIEIGTSFGPLHGRIWRIGTMGYNAREDAVEQTLRALETVLSQQKHKVPRGAAVDAALSIYR